MLEEGQIREPVLKLDKYRSMLPDGMKSQLLRELADVIARPFLLILERS